MKQLLVMIMLALAGCQTMPATPPDTLDSIARDYVRLSLAIGLKEDGYIDAYYGPPAWRDAAKADRRPLGELRARADSLAASLGTPPAGDGMVGGRPSLSVVPPSPTTR